jgi:hypothetical protein
LHATTFGPEPDEGLPVLPGRVAERLLCAACCSEAGLIGGSEGADIGAGVAGEGSGRERVAMCGNSLKNGGRTSAGGMGSLEREEEGIGAMSPRSSCICPNGGKGCWNSGFTFVLLFCVEDSGDGSSGSADLSSALSLSLSSPLRCLAPRRFVCGI